MLYTNYNLEYFNNRGKNALNSSINFTKYNKYNIRNVRNYSTKADDVYLSLSKYSKKELGRLLHLKYMRYKLLESFANKDNKNLVPFTSDIDKRLREIDKEIQSKYERDDFINMHKVAEYYNSLKNDK